MDKIIKPKPFNKAGEDYVHNLRDITDIKGELTSIYDKRVYNSQLANLRNNGKYLVMGCYYDFRPYLKRYAYKQYGWWHEVYAPNKTLLRKSTYGKIDKIVEVK